MDYGAPMPYGAATPQQLSGIGPLPNIQLGPMARSATPAPAQMPMQAQAEAPMAQQPMGGQMSRSALLASVLAALGKSASPGATGMPSFGGISPEMIAQAQTARTQYANNAATNAAHAANPGALQFNKPDVISPPWQNLPTNGFQGFGQNFSDAAKRLGGLFGLGSGAGMGPNS